MVITMDLSGQLLHMTESEYRDGTVAAAKAVSVQLPEGCVRNGIVTDEDAFVGAVSSAMRGAGFTARKVNVAIGSGVIATKTMTVPAAGPKQLRGIIRSEIDRFSSGEEQKARGAEGLFDYIILGPSADDGTKLRIMAVMLPETIAESWLSVIQKLGKKPGALDCWYNAALKAVALDPEMAACPAGILASLDAESVNLLLFESGAYGMYRNVPVTAQGPAVQNEFILSSLGSTAAPSPGDSVYSAAYDGISKLLQFQSIRNRQNPIQRIYLCGALSGDAGLAARLAEAFSMPAGATAKCSAVTLPGDAVYSEYFCAIGAAVRK